MHNREGCPPHSLEKLNSAKKPVLRQMTSAHSSEPRSQTLWRRGLWGLALYLAAAVAVIRANALLPFCPPSWRELLGATPPVILIDLALALYLGSALILAAARLGRPTPCYRGWQTIALVLPFNFFFWYGGILPERFSLVTAAGMVLLILEQAALWRLCRRTRLIEGEECTRLLQQIRLLRPGDPPPIRKKTRKQ